VNGLAGDAGRSVHVLKKNISCSEKPCQVFISCKNQEKNPCSEKARTYIHLSVLKEHAMPNVTRKIGIVCQQSR
jgi:hypothetical protein